MTPDGRFIALLVTILTGLSIIMGGLLWLGRVLWNIRGSWDHTNDELHTLVDKVGALVARDDRLEARIERHESWHARRWWMR
jgi:hypothetical protein